MRQFCLALMASLALLCGAGAQDKGGVPLAEREALAGPWTGSWTGHDYVYDGVMTLEVDVTGGVEGEIRWTLRETPFVDERDKVGLEGVEHVRGRYHHDAGALTLAGYERDDPHDILGLDSYRLVVGENHATMIGLTGNGGTWDGLITLER